MDKLAILLSASIVDNYKHIESVSLEYRFTKPDITSISIQFYDGVTNASIVIYNFLDFSSAELDEVVSLIKNKYIKLSDVINLTKKFNKY
jgi:hypothetical protein